MEVELRAVEKMHTAVATAPSTFNYLEVKTLNTACLEHFWTLEHNFSWQAQMDLALSQKWSKREGFLRHFLKTLARIRRLSRICKDACRVACWEVRPLIS